MVNNEDNAIATDEHSVNHEYLTITFNDTWGYCKARGVHNEIQMYMWGYLAAVNGGYDGGK